MRRPPTLVLVPHSPAPPIARWRREQRDALCRALLRDGRVPFQIPGYADIESDLSPAVAEELAESYGAVIGRHVLADLFILLRNDGEIDALQRAAYRGWAVARGVSRVPGPGVPGLVLVRWRECEQLLRRTGLESLWTRHENPAEIPAPVIA